MWLHVSMFYVSMFPVQLQLTAHPLCSEQTRVLQCILEKCGLKAKMLGSLIQTACVVSQCMLQPTAKAVSARNT